MKNCAIIYAESDPGGDQTHLPMQFRPIAGLPLLAHTINAFENSPAIDEIILVVDERYLLYVSEHVVDRNHFDKIHKIRVGGETRFQSVLSGLEGLSRDTDIVLIHDALRPFISGTDLDTLIDECLSHGAIAMGIPADMPVKRAEEGYILASLDRNRIYLMQSPQAFRYSLIMDAYRNALSGTQAFADDAAVVEFYGHKVKVVDGDKSNIRIISERDFQVAKYLLEKPDRTEAGNV